MKKKIAAAIALAGPVLAFAEGESSATTSQLSSWVGSAQTEVAGWASTLSPLFTAGIGIILLVVAWKLFKRVTKTAS